MAESELERFLRRERPELVDELAPHRDLARELAVFGQAVLGGWCEFARAVRPLVDDPRASALLAVYGGDAAGYFPADPDHDRGVIPIYFGASVNGVMEDLETSDARIDDLSASLADLHEFIQVHGAGTASIYGTGVFHEVVHDALRSNLNVTQAAPAVGCLFPWQRLAWLSECRLRHGAVLARGRGEPLIGAHDEQLAYLLRLAANQPGLANWPELARFVPRRAGGLLPLSERAYQRFRRGGIPDDPELGNRLVAEIVEQRHYVLDTISVIELDELGVKRIVLTPEERPDATITGSQPHFVLGFLVDHAVGAFAGTITLGGEETVAGTGHRAVLMVPAIMSHLRNEDGPANEDEDEYGMRVLHEAQAAIELLLLSAWRDLVVPDVREQHYETDRVRKAKGSGKRASRRGNLEVVRYLPRRLIYGRAAREAASREGRSEPRQLYAVSAFSRRLPAGQTRSAEAEEFARASGIPLAPHQTVVRPHFRGGTQDERRAAMETRFGDEMRRWRSWSALDLLRTRATLSRAADPAPGPG